MKKLSLVGLILLAPQVNAAPPQDLSVFESSGKSRPLGPPAIKRPTKLKEDHITAGDPVPGKVAPATQGTPQVIKYDVVCRETAGRQGKAKVKLPAKARVLLHKSANNWSEVSFAPKQAACWVPSSAL